MNAEQVATSFKAISSPWYVASLVARMVYAVEPEEGKIQYEEFARLAGVPEVEVLHQMWAWDHAAMFGYVPRSRELSPDDEFNLDGLTKGAWDYYRYGKTTKARTTGPPKKTAPKKIKRCKWCDREFHTGERFCSNPLCQARKDVRTGECEWCHEPFEAGQHNQRFCSAAHKQAAYRARNKGDGPPE